MSVTTAIIPAAGLGTRMKPVTDFIPKELLPIGTKPSLYFVIEEAHQSGIQEIILILSEAKRPFMKHLEEMFPMLHFEWILQEKPLGLGHAVSLAEKLAKDPFMVLLPDDIIDSSKPACKQLIEAFQETKQSINATKRMPQEELHLYGVYEIENSKGSLHRAKRVIEKPKSGEEPSQLVVVGRYLFTPEIFSILKKTPPGRKNEIQLADAMNTLASQGKLYAFEFEGQYIDIGNPKGMIRANIYFGMKEYGTDIYQGLKITSPPNRPY